MGGSSARAVSHMLSIFPSVQGLMVLVLFPTCFTFLILLLFQCRHIEIECIVWVVCQVEVRLLTPSHDCPSSKSTNGVVAVEANCVVVLQGRLSLLSVTLLQVVVRHHFEVFANFTSAKVPSEVNVVNFTIDFRSFVIVRPIAEYIVRRLFLHLIISKS